MEIRFEPGDPGDGQDLRSLYRWLRGDATLRGLVRVEAANEQAKSGEMGAGLDAVVAAVSAAVSAGAAIGQLAISVAAWRAARGSGPTITIIVPGGDPEAALPIIRALQDAKDPEDEA